MIDRRGIVRLATLVGGSAGLYSVALATVVSLQSQADAATIAGRQPVVDAIGAVEGSNDREGGDRQRGRDLEIDFVRHQRRL